MIAQLVSSVYVVTSKPGRFIGLAGVHGHALRPHTYFDLKAYSGTLRFFCEYILNKKEQKVFANSLKRTKIGTLQLFGTEMMRVPGHQSYQQKNGEIRHGILFSGLAGILCICLFQGLIQPAWAQGDASQYWLPQLPKIEYGEIPDSLLRMKQYPGNPDLDYFFAYKGLNIHFDVNNKSLIAELTYLVRIKVLKEAGIKASVVDIPYYYQNDMEKVTAIQGHTIHPNGSRVNLDTTTVRTIEVNSRYKLREFQLPDVHPGSILEYRYTIRRRYIEELPDFYFMNTRPTKLSVVRLVNSKYIRYDVKPVNMKQSSPHFVEQKIDTTKDPNIFTRPEGKPILIDYWFMKDIPGLREEPYITSLNDYRWKLKFSWKSFGDPRQIIEKGWDIVVAELRRNHGFLKNIPKYPELDSLGGTFRRIKDPVVRMDSVFRYVNDHATYNGSEGVLSQAPLDSVLKGRPSDQPAINQALIAVLRGAGIRADPLLTATRKTGRILSDYPSLFQFNVMMVRAQAGGEIRLMDATQKHSIPGLLPLGTIGGKGLVVEPRSYQWVSLNPDPSRFEMDVKLNADLDEQGDLEGHLAVSHYGYLARKIRDQLTTDLKPSEIVRQDLLGRYIGVTIDSVQVKGNNAYGDPVILSAHFKIPGYAISYQKGLEFSPLVVGYRMHNPFGGGRHLPVTLSAPEKLNASFHIRIPRGYSLKHSNKNAHIEIPGANLGFNYRIGSRSLDYTLHVAVLRTDFGQDLFPQLINLYDQWVELSRTRLFIRKK